MKLAGLRVVDLSTFLPGPYLTMSMADHGAEVIKIEQPGGGDPTRGIGLSDGRSTVLFRNFNRGKKSVVVDLKCPAERDKVLELCEGADVFVETFRPGVADRLGLGYAALAVRNPRIVYCSISAFGNQGPYRQRPAHDLALQAITGALSFASEHDGEPTLPAIPISDHLSALQGLTAILMALIRRERTGRGDHIDISMHDAMLAATANIVGPTFAEARQPVPRHERTLGGAAFYRVYRTRTAATLRSRGRRQSSSRRCLGPGVGPTSFPYALRSPDRTSSR